MNNQDAPFIIDRNYTFFTPLDILSTILGLSIILIIIYMRQRRNNELEYYKYYSTAFLFKITFVLANALFYIISYGAGGDSIGFWDSGVKLNNLFWKDPMAYFEEIFEFSEIRHVYKNFDINTGYPDGRMYSEPASWFVGKIASVFTFITFKGYILMSFIFAFITLNASWKLYELVRSFKLHTDWHLALAIFFIPSLSFWCGGISKDTVMWVTLCYFLHNLYKIVSLDKKASFWNWLGILICMYIFLKVRSFMIVTVTAPMLFAYGARISKRFGKNSLELTGLRILIAGLAISSIFLFFQTSIADEYLKEAEVINLDMTTNKTYGTNRYNLGITDYSPLGMVMAMPASIMAGVFRPYIWEALSVSLFLNGIESLVLMYFTARFFFSYKLRSRIRNIRQHEFLVYAFFFAIILAYFAGFTSILFGVLVRFKAPVLPFLVMVLTAHYQKEKLEKNQLPVDDIPVKGAS